MSDEVRCDSVDCSVLYARVKAAWDLDDVAGIPKLVHALQARHEGPKKTTRVIPPSKHGRRKQSSPEIIVID
jgi:hypothetical protein